MGAIEQGGYRFELEYSVVQQKGALHVYSGEEFIKEITFDYDGDMPSTEALEPLIDKFLEEQNCSM
jgi:hypothetical protein